MNNHSFEHQIHLAKLASHASEAERRLNLMKNKTSLEIACQVSMDDQKIIHKDLEYALEASRALETRRAQEKDRMEQAIKASLEEKHEAIKASLEEKHEASLEGKHEASLEEKHEVEEGKHEVEEDLGEMLHSVVRRGTTWDALIDALERAKGRDLFECLDDGVVSRYHRFPTIASLKAAISGLEE